VTVEKFNLKETYFLKVLTVHFEGISGKRHRTNVSYVSDNVSFSWSPVLGTAEVAGFLAWGTRKAFQCPDHRQSLSFYGYLHFMTA
jgi:hypothetical protein